MCLQTPAPYPEHTHLLNTGPRQVQEGDVMWCDEQGPGLHWAA